MVAITEGSQYPHTPGSGRYTDYGRESRNNPAFRRMEGLGAGFGQQYGGAFQQQRDMYNQFGQMAAGQGPSLAQDQLMRGVGQASQMATGAALGARGGNVSGGQMAAANVGATMGAQAAMDSAALRQQEQIAAMSAQAGMANQMAGQSLQGQLGMEGLYQGALGQQLDANLRARELRNQQQN